MEEAARKAKAHREKEERELSKLQELERIRSGKELAEAKRIEESQQVCICPAWAFVTRFAEEQLTACSLSAGSSSPLQHISSME